MNAESTREGAATAPMYFELPTAERPPARCTSASEVYLLQMINRGLLLVSAFHAAGGVQQDNNVYHPTAPPWGEPETYYEPITDILQAANQAGLKPEALCQQAIDNQQLLKDEAQQEANRLRGQNPDAETTGDIEPTAVVLGQR